MTRWTTHFLVFLGASVFCFGYFWHYSGLVQKSLMAAVIAGGYFWVFMVIFSWVYMAWRD